MVAISSALYQSQAKHGNKSRWEGGVPAQGDGLRSECSCFGVLLALPLLLCALKVWVHLQLPWVHALQLACSMHETLFTPMKTVGP